MKRWIKYTLICIAGFLITLALLSFIVGFVSTFVKNALTPPPPPIPSTPTKVATLWELTNKDRQDAGLPPLVLNQKLNLSAQEKCDDMDKKHYFDHESPDGVLSQDVVSKYIDYTRMGENLADSFNSLPDVNTAWMNSPEHKDNILYPFTDVGFAICGKNNRYIVQHFIMQK